MIYPVFFPFTHVDPVQEQALLSVFRFMFFMPVSTRSLVSRDIDHPGSEQALEPVWPLGPEPVQAAVRAADEYIKWGELNYENGTHLKTLINQMPYGTDDTAVTALKSKLLAPGGPDIEPAGEVDEKLFQALLFLRMAQLSDEQKAQVDSSFDALNRKHADLFSRITPENEDHLFDNLPPAGKQSFWDPGSYLTAKRIQAWFMYFIKGRTGPEHGQMPVLVTTSQAVFDHLASFDKKLVNALDIDRIKVHENNCAEDNTWQERFYGLVHSAYGKGPGHDDGILVSGDRCGSDARIKLYLLSGRAIDTIVQNRYETIPVCLVKLN